MVLQCASYESLSEPTLLRSLMSSPRRPNLVIVCKGVEPLTVVRHLRGWCARPVRYFGLPSAPCLPSRSVGTLLLNEVDALTLTQQIELWDWLGSGGYDAHIVSVATAPLERLVMAGRFLEALFWKLNVVRLDARPDDAPRLEGQGADGPRLLPDVTASYRSGRATAGEARCFEVPAPEWEDSSDDCSHRR